MQTAGVTDEIRAGADREMMERFRVFRAGHDRRLRNQLVEQHRWLAHVAVRRFTNRGEPLDDLLQVALLGVVKAVERFDPDYGSSFATFALPTITGELRRHFRDATWALRVSRRAKEMHLALAAAIEPLTHRLGRPPRLDELASALGVTLDELVEAMEAGNAYRTSPLTHRNNDDGTTEDVRAVAFDDHSLATADTRVILHKLLAELPERERRIVYLRFFSDLTQSEIAEQVGVSQVHVSRLLRATLETLRTGLESESRPQCADASPHDVAAVWEEN
jgi:RNA polymerase sigma-B factor